MLIANFFQPWPHQLKAQLQVFVLGHSWVPLCLQQLLPGLTSEKRREVSQQLSQKDPALSSYPPSRMPGHWNTLVGRCFISSRIQGSSSGKRRGWAPTTTKRCVWEGPLQPSDHQLPFSSPGLRVTRASGKGALCSVVCSAPEDWLSNLLRVKNQSVSFLRWEARGGTGDTITVIWQPAWDDKGTSYLLCPETGGHRGRPLFIFTVWEPLFQGGLKWGTSFYNFYFYTYYFYFNTYM